MGVSAVSVEFAMKDWSKTPYCEKMCPSTVAEAP